METQAEPHRHASFGDLLRGYRVAAGVTQEELAERAGLSVRAISDLERIQPICAKYQYELVGPVPERA